jgi:hypothetical protein
MILYVGGNPLYWLIQYSGGYSMVNAPDALTCCQLCANTVDCSGYTGPVSGYTDCYLIGDAGTCDASQNYFTIDTCDGQCPDNNYGVVGNGNCGQGNYGGVYD